MSKKIDDWYKNHYKNHYHCHYPYYFNDFFGENEKFKRNVGVNCSDDCEEKIKGALIRKHCVRKATPEEIEWIKKQPKIDINAPEHESLKKAIIYLHRIGVFNEK